MDEKVINIISNFLMRTRIGMRVFLANKLAEELLDGLKKEGFKIVKEK